MIMDEQQVIDFMLARGYSLYVKKPGHEEGLVFLHIDHPNVSAKVRWTKSGDVDVKLGSIVGMVVVETLWFDIDHPKFHSVFEAQIERALRSMGAWE
jgi:hypothetical protein